MKLKARRLGLMLLAGGGVVAVTAYGVSGVQVHASLGGGNGCSPDSPIAIIVSNYTLSRVSSVIISLEAWRNGNSTNILSGRDYRFPLVLLPLETKSACYSDRAFAVSKEASLNASVKQDFETVSLSGAINEVRQVRALLKNVELIVTDVEVIRK
ncbi:hypothetical protein [Pseudomonas syringae]|uniref:hypothetical protein n=1 Tax=Pseudomonas syringae TaxID=317 RepID=UPI0005169B09|nr:hypothetical protein [Pseudomonas syringae]